MRYFRFLAISLLALSSGKFYGQTLVKATNAAVITVQNGAVFFADGVISVDNNASLNNNGAISVTNGSIQNNGIYSGNGSVNNTPFTNTGTVLPQNCLTYGGDFTSSGTFAVDINGATACTLFDQLSITGTATVGGILNVNFGSFTPNPNQAFQIINAGAYSGSFSTINVTPSSFTATYSNGVLTVGSTVTPAINGMTTNCGSVTLTASGGTSYAWSGGNTPNAATNTFTTSGNYTVTVTNSIGSTTTASTTVTVHPSLTPSVSGSTTGCGSVSLTASGGTSYAWSGGNTPNAATNTFTTSGNYTVTVTNTEGCQATLTRAVIVNPIPAPTITGTTTACGSVSLTANNGVLSSSNTYVWSSGLTPNAAINTFTTSGNYIVTVTNTEGCAATANATVTINAIPTVVITGATVGCLSVNLTASGGNTYLWNGGSTPNTAANTFTTSGAYTLTVTGSNGCSATANATVTVGTNPVVSITGTTSACQSVTLTASATGTSGVLTYAWSGGNTPTMPNNTFTTNGTYTVSVTNGGCTVSASTTVSITPLLSRVYVNVAATGTNNGTSWIDAFTSLQSALSSCIGANSEIWVAAGTYKPSAFPTGCTNCGTDPRNYTFMLKEGVKMYGGFYGDENSVAERHGGNSILSGEIGSAALTDNCNHVVVSFDLSSATVMDKFVIEKGYANIGQVLRIQLGVNYNRELYPYYGGGIESTNSSLTLNNIVFLNNFGGAGGGGLDNYASYKSEPVSVSNCLFVGNSANNGGAIESHGVKTAIINSVFVNNTSIQTSALFVEYNSSSLFTTSVKNCIFWNNTNANNLNILNRNSLNTISVTYSAVQGGFTGTGNINTNPLFLNLTDPDGGDNIWFTADDGLQLNCGSPAFNTGTNTDAPSKDALGVSRPQYSTTDMGAYENTANLSASGLSTPTVAISGETTVCGTSTTLTASGGTTYIWSGGSSPNNATNTFTTSGTYSLVVTNSAGCSAVSTVVVTIKTPLTTPSINPTATTACRVTLTASGAASYVWSGGSTPNAATNQFTTSGNYTVTATAANGCTATGTTTVNLTPIAATISISQTASTVCRVTLTASGGVSYIWNGGSTPNSAVNNFTASGTYTVTGTDADGCVGTAQSTLAITPTPATITVAQTATSCNSATLTANGGVSYIWNGGNTPTNAVNTFTIAGNYTVTGTNADGCVATINTTVSFSNATVYYVNVAATGLNNGTSWANAYTSLQSALNVSSYPCNTEIWVAAGTYKPTAFPRGCTNCGTDTRNYTFHLIEGVKMYGGFFGDEMTLAERHGGNTILSGDIGTTANADNCFHVVVGSDLTNATVLDKFIIEKGHAANYSGSSSYISIVGGASIFKIWGGGMSNFRSAPKLNALVFRDNIASICGGLDILTFGNSEEFLLTNSVFINNSNGAINNEQAKFRAINCVFINNIASGNSIISNYASQTSYGKLQNCIGWGNSNPATSIHTSATVQNSYFQSATVTADPQFVNRADPDGTDNIWFTADDGLFLGYCSPALNTGSNAHIPTGIKDIMGATRIQQNTIDMGAYETHYTLDGNILTANAECIDATGWTHYTNTNSKALLLSLKKNGNTIGSVGDGTFSVLSGSSGVRNLGTSQGANAAPYATTANWHVMGRYWKVTPNPQPTSPVNMRFYYQQADFTDVQTAGGISAETNLVFYKINGNHDPNPALRHVGVPTARATAYNTNGYWEYYNGTTPSSNNWASGSENGSKYAEMVVASFSGGGGGAGSGLSGGALPIELLNFYGNTVECSEIPTCVGKGFINKLSWATLTEVNNKGFDIERSIDGINFIKIGWKAGQGTTQTHAHYTFSDFSPTVGINYYRLKQIDFDGQYAYSKIIQLENLEISEILKVYPNPISEGAISIEIPQHTEGVSIFNSIGQLIFQQHIKGKNMLQIDVSTWAQGVYFVKTSRNSQFSNLHKMEQIKFIKN